MDDIITLSKEEYNKMKKYTWTSYQVGLYGLACFGFGVLITLLMEG